MRPIHGIAALTLVASLVPARTHAQATPPPVTKGGVPRAAGAQPARAPTCNVEGVWGLVGVQVDGKDTPLNGFRERKIVARGHFMWIGSAARRDTIQATTAADSLRATQVSGGTGTYTLSGTTYTEHLDYFVLPSMEGTDFPATCRTEGDRWYHTYPMGAGTGAPATGTPRMKTEIWRRIR